MSDGPASLREGLQCSANRRHACLPAHRHDSLFSLLDGCRWAVAADTSCEPLCACWGCPACVKAGCCACAANSPTLPPARRCACSGKREQRRGAPGERAGLRASPRLPVHNEAFHTESLKVCQCRLLHIRHAVVQSGGLSAAASFHELGWVFQPGAAAVWVWQLDEVGYGLRGGSPE